MILHLANDHRPILEIARKFNRHLRIHQTIEDAPRNSLTEEAFHYFLPGTAAAAAITETAQKTDKNRERTGKGRIENVVEGQSGRARNQEENGRHRYNPFEDGPSDVNSRPGCGKGKQDDQDKLRCGGNNQRIGHLVDVFAENNVRRYGNPTRGKKHDDDSCTESADED